jgi:hypothetical protein
VVEGLAVGVLTGLVGVGGGFLIVPALVLLAKVPMKQAVGTSLLIIAMKSATGFLGYLGQVEVPWAFMTLFTAVAVAGIFAGTWLVRFVPQAALQARVRSVPRRDGRLHSVPEPRRAAAAGGCARAARGARHELNTCRRPAAAERRPYHAAGLPAAP